MRLSTTFFTLLLGSAAFGQVWEKPIAPGLTYRMEVEAAGPRLIHALRYTPGAPGLRLSAELAGGTINEEGTVKGRLAPSRMAKDLKAIAAINSDFFSFEHGAPIGLMVRNGELLTSPFKPRSTFGWGQETVFGFPSFRATATEESGLSLPLSTINQPVGQNQIGLYTPVSGLVEISGENLMALIKLDEPTVKPDGLLHGTVDYLIADSQRMNVPAGKVLILARGNKTQVLANLRPERKVVFDIQTRGFDWSKVENAVGGGPFLLKEGRVAIDALEEGFNASFSDARHPRTAVGKTKEGDIWFVAVDGRQSMSIGATLREMADIMLRLGCVDAMNLDGGGSTNLHLLGVTVNRPSDNAERPVSSALLFFAPQPEAVKGTAKIELPSTFTPGSQFEAKFMIDGKQVPHSEVIWSMQGAGWIDQGGLVRLIGEGKATLTAYSRGNILSITIPVKAPSRVLHPSKRTTAKVGI
ncbi:MAG: phosphodiester glycosidase family protein [Fimbriimonas sp.]